MASVWSVEYANSSPRPADARSSAATACSDHAATWTTRSRTLQSPTTPGTVTRSTSTSASASWNASREASSSVTRLVSSATRPLPEDRAQLIGMLAVMRCAVLRDAIRQRGAIGKTLRQEGGIESAEALHQHLHRCRLALANGRQIGLARHPGHGLVHIVDRRIIDAQLLQPILLGGVDDLDGVPGPVAEVRNQLTRAPFTQQTRRGHRLGRHGGKLA